MNKLDGGILYSEYGECRGFSCVVINGRIELYVEVDSFYMGGYTAVTEIKKFYFYDIENNREMRLGEGPEKALSFGKSTGEMLAAKSV